MQQARPRLLIFVIAYQAESTLVQVLERLPRSVLEECSCEILVVDDASRDRTYEIGHEYKRAHPGIPLTVLRNSYNQGYGGNQKVGYAYAVEEGFDFVAMIHGDGQYAPEELPNLLVPLRDDGADAVLGSRMMSRFGALKGGMPLYKYVGNKILTTVQNGLLGTKLSEFHSGYRLYRVSTLARLPLGLNSNDFHFDTEIILQLVNAGARIVELPIPTYYGGEISRVNGLDYARNVVLATLRNVAHRSGLLYQRKYDVSVQDNSHYSPKLGYPSSHTYALEAVPDHSRVMDLGSGPGHLAPQLVDKGCEVTVVDREKHAALPARVTAVRRDLNEVPLELAVADIDVILMLDVIEHLAEPEAFLAALRRNFDHRPRTMIFTTPNVAFVVQRLMLLIGQFNYGKAGILDRRHTRLFTFRSFLRLLRDSGFRIRRVRGVPAPFPKVLGTGPLGLGVTKLNQLLIWLSRSLFAYQIFVVAETTPDVEFVLEDSRISAHPGKLSARAQVSARTRRLPRGHTPRA
jgi:glycosyltransferase involved in cell wall biosynthesis